MLKFMNDKLTEDDELTSTKLQGLLLEKQPELNMSLDTIEEDKDESVRLHIIAN